MTNFFLLFPKKCVILQIMKHIGRTLCILLAFIMMSSCNGVEKIVKSNDFDAKYQAAMHFYNENSYSKAIQIFENLILYYRGKENAENISWYYAQCLIKEDDYYSAAYQLKNFARQFPYSERAEEAAFLSAYCKYKNSPVYSLDQTLTKEAIADFENFAARYPQNAHIPEVNEYLDEMRQKLMLKDYEIAYNYYHIEAYHAAYVSLQNFLNLYPDSDRREDAMYYMLRSGFEYASNSREDKMYERLQQVVNDFDRFATLFANSKYLASAQDIYTKCRSLMANLENPTE